MILLGTSTIENKYFLSYILMYFLNGDSIFFFLYFNYFTAGGTKDTRGNI